MSAPRGRAGRPPRHATVLDRVRRAGRDGEVSLVVADGTITALGPAVDPPPGAERVDCSGRVVVPGLWDMHVHVDQWALARRRVDLSATTSPAHAARVLGEAAAARDDGSLVVGGGMRTALWDTLPHRDVLDAATGDVPVVATNVDLHTVWCNGAALRLFDAQSDSGLLREADGYRVLAALDDLTVDAVDAAVDAALDEAATRGITGVKDFEFSDAVAQWQRRTRAGAPPVRIDTTVYASHLDAAIARGLATDEVVPATSGMLRAGHLKLFTDGALNSGTALCHEVGADGTAGASGHAAMTRHELRDLVTRAWEHGIAPAIHAIGDLAVSIALDVFEEVGCPGRIEHAQLVADDDVARFSRPGLVAGVQPAHCTDDRDVTDLLWADRAHRAYPFASLVGAGARLEFGSDAPVSPLDPWAAIAAAVTRTDDDRPSWHPEQCLDRRTALTAAARGRRDLRVGDPADLAVLDDDPLTCDMAVLRAGPVAATMVAGRWTFRR
jgi:predicted amidohydrolase YtcJ